MRVLLIAYHYPPMNNGGVQRPLKIAKYLPHFGHEVKVLTHSHSSKKLTVEDCVLRVYDINKVGSHKYYWLPIRLLQKAETFLGSYRSPYSFWLESAKKDADSILQLSKPDVIFATYPPHETLELGLYFAEKYDLPLISDFRDGLLFESIEGPNIKRTNTQSYLSKVESRVAKHSAVVTTVSEPISEYFRNTYGHRAVHTIPNGFDPEDFKLSSELPPLDKTKFNIVYTGRLETSERERKANIFFEAVEELVRDVPTLSEKMRLHFLGQFSPKELNVMRRLREIGLLSVTGVLPREQSLAYQKNADLLLLITAINRTSVVTGKLFEYLYAAKPILALTHDTYAEKILRETSAGWIVHPHKKVEIFDILLKVITDQSFYNSLSPDRSKILQYSRVNQVGTLGKLIDQLAS